MSKDKQGHVIEAHGTVSTFYVENINPYVNMYKKNYFLGNDTGCRTVENGYILPYTQDKTNAVAGGVYDADGRCVAAHRIGNTHGSCHDFDLRNTQHSDETVIYAGFLSNHYGHFILESLSRMWYFLERNSKETSRYKVIFSQIDDSHLNTANMTACSFLTEIFQLLGIQNTFEVITKPVRYTAILLPDEMHHLSNGYKTKAKQLYDAIRDSVAPLHKEKIYLSRTKTDRHDCINEEYFENFYQKLGYEVIYPEQLSITEQISLMAGAKEVVCTGGTLHHQILFCNDGVDITVLNRNVEVACHPPIVWINQLRRAVFVCVDVSKNFMPSLEYYSTYLLAPTKHFQQYAFDFMDISFLDFSLSNETIIEYICKWSEKMSHASAIRHTDFYSPNLLADMVMDIQKYLLGRKTNECAAKAVWMRDYYFDLSLKEFKKIVFYGCGRYLERLHNENMLFYMPDEIWDEDADSINDGSRGEKRFLDGIQVRKPDLGTAHKSEIAIIITIRSKSDRTEIKRMLNNVGFTSVYDSIFLL